MSTEARSQVPVRISDDPISGVFAVPSRRRALQRRTCCSNEHFPSVSSASRAWRRTNPKEHHVCRHFN